MRIAVLRHAKSSWDEPNVDDFNRRLNERGRKAARRIGQEITRRGFHFDLVLASPAVRVRETIAAVKFGPDARVRFDRSLYLASEEMLLGIIRDLPETVRSPLLVGHNPGLQRLLVELSHDDERELRRRVSHKLPTAALAIIELPGERWGKVEPGSGTIVELIVPKELD